MNELQARFFIAKAVYRTWPKIYILTSDGVLYCEYLDYMKRTIDRHRGIDFEKFTASDYKFDNYQELEEVSYEEAVGFVLTRQENWVERYLREKQ